MILHEINVPVYAYRDDVVRHDEFRAAFEDSPLGPQAFGYSPFVLSGFIRIVTHPRVFALPTAIEDALEFVEAVREQPNAVEMGAGPRHWAIFPDLCRSAEVKGNLVSDAYHAALAIESGSEWVTTDRDYARFQGLRWRHPLG